MNRTQIAARVGVSYQLLNLWFESGLLSPFDPANPTKSLQEARVVIRARKKGKSVQRIRVELAFERGKAVGTSAGQ